MNNDIFKVLFTRITSLPAVVLCCPDSIAFMRQSLKLSTPKSSATIPVLLSLMQFNVSQNVTAECFYHKKVHLLKCEIFSNTKVLNLKSLLKYSHSFVNLHLLRPYYSRLCATNVQERLA